MHDAAHIAAMLLRAGIVVGGVVALRRSDAAAAVNAAFALAVALLPAGLAAAAPSAVGEAMSAASELSLWLALAGFLHLVGMLGWYDTVRWWDHLTHTVSAALVASLVYGGLLVVSRSSSGLGLRTGGIVGATLGLVFAIGVLWEIGELLARDVADRLDIEPVLVHYGRRDTALDLVFDVVGALLVVVVDVRLFVPVAALSPSTIRTALLWVGWSVGGGSLLLATGLLLSRGRGESS
ncbi:hypothetical protein GRX01_04335 [Halobaculum sp. WSA2]|uniref:Uncharacterized protein n=1 Tax=Halobaculum saliterrae TaxID=2073113 RepID=A0A6B0SPC7_9EURY|nr:hypothetical protein [Halobaculum saliterrae]MXR40575.1 hypothetical protein [Halobaculum saliterrae]